MICNGNRQKRRRNPIAQIKKSFESGGSNTRRQGGRRPVHKRYNFWWEILHRCVNTSQVPPILLFFMSGGDPYSIQCIKSSTKPANFLEWAASAFEFRFQWTTDHRKRKKGGSSWEGVLKLLPDHHQVCLFVCLFVYMYILLFFLFDYRKRKNIRLRRNLEFVCLGW